VAGMCEADISIRVEKNFLVISGVRADEQQHRYYHQMEIRFGEFSTAVEIPPMVDVNSTNAEYKDGLLTVLLPKLKPTQIKVQG
jgi:HSP20 family protein